MSDNRPKDIFAYTQDVSLNKFIFSSPMRFGGKFENEKFLLTHAFPGMDNSALRHQQHIRNSASRYYYIMMFHAEPYEQIGPTRRVNDYTYFAQSISAALAVYFGKQFDFHGIIEHAGLYNIPMMNNIGSLADISLGPYDDQPRKCIEIDLNFTHCAPILRLFEAPSVIDERLVSVFLIAARLYLRSLQSYHQDPENAYIDLVVCGEVISGYCDNYAEAELYDEQLQTAFAAINASGIEQKHVNLIKSRLYQVKRKFKISIRKLLNASFYDKSDAPWPHYAVSSDTIDNALSATYDLRSDHTHTGFHFAPYIIPFEKSDLCMGGIRSDDRNRKYCNKALSFAGLERTIRFCLLRMLQKSGLEIHMDLA